MKLSKREIHLVILGLGAIGIIIIVAGFFWIFGS